MKWHLLSYLAVFLLYVLIFGPIGYQMWVYNYSYEDAVQRVWSFLVKEHAGTKWPSNWSEKRFDDVRIGMGKTNVLAILGEPFFYWYLTTDNEEAWAYTQGLGGSHDVRRVSFKRSQDNLASQTNWESGTFTVTRIERSYYSCGKVAERKRKELGCSSPTGNGDVSCK